VSVFPDNDNWRTTADLYVGILPWRNLFDRSPYRGDELNQFQNTALVNNQGLLTNSISPTVAIAWHQGLGQHFGLDATLGLKTIDTADFADGWTLSEELALNYDTSFLGVDYTKPGTLFVGGYHIFFDGNSNPRILTGPVRNRDGELLHFSSNGDDSLQAVYVGWNQEWWRGIGTSIDWVLNQNNPNNALLTALQNGTGVNASLNAGGNIEGVQSAISAVISLPMTVFNKNLTNRAHDLFGFGYSYINPTELADGGTTILPANLRSNSFTNSNEHVFELFYRWAINNSMTVIPSAQVIVNRAGVRDNDADVIFGLRTNYVF